MANRLLSRLFSARTLREDERVLYQLGNRLLQFNIRPAGNFVFRILRYRRRHVPADVGKEPQTNPARPAGPFRKAQADAQPAIIDYVPRDVKSRLIDNLTGGYGYSHITVDLGEIDEPTGKPVMIESTPFDVVHYAFQDEYGSRSYIRVPLGNVGVDYAEFSACVKSKLGEKYDDYEALTWGEVDDPAKQICSNLAADCLPEQMRQDIAHKRETGLLKKHSISVHPRRDGSLGVFVSPDGFAQYFQAPHGEDIKQPGVTVEPKVITPVTDLLPVPISKRTARRGLATTGLLLGIAGTAILVTIVLSRNSKQVRDSLRTSGK